MTRCATPDRQLDHSASQLCLSTTSLIKWYKIKGKQARACHVLVVLILLALLNLAASLLLHSSSNSAGTRVLL